MYHTLQIGHPGKTRVWASSAKEVCILWVLLLLSCRKLLVSSKCKALPLNMSLNTVFPLKSRDGLQWSCTVPMFSVKFILRGARLHAVWVFRWLLSPIWALNSWPHWEQGCTCSCCPSAGGLGLSILYLRCTHFWVAMMACCFTLEQSLLQQVMIMQSSQTIASMLQHFSEVFRVSLYHLLWPSWECFPARSSPIQKLFGRCSLVIQTFESGPP